MPGHPLWLCYYIGPWLGPSAGQAWQAGSPDAWLGDDIPWLWALGSSRARLQQQGSWTSSAVSSLLEAMMSFLG